MTDQQPPHEGQLATSLPGPVVFVTGLGPDGTAVVRSRRPAAWGTYGEGEMQMAVAWTTASFPADLDGDKDIATHDARMAAGPMGLVGKGLVGAGGTVLRYVDFAPGYECIMHRTVSVDYGIVLEGEILSRLDSGEATLMRRGDVMVQRATMHAWKNPSATAWARMVFALQECLPPTFEGKALGQDLGPGIPPVLPPPGDDAAAPSSSS